MQAKLEQLEKVNLEECLMVGPADHLLIRKFSTTIYPFESGGDPCDRGAERIFQSLQSTNVISVSSALS
jgi:hypothetical protein